MDLFDVVRSCFRRWYVFVPLLAIVTWLSYSTYNSVQPVYYSNAVIGLAAPSSRIDNAVQGVPVPRNGLLDVGGASLIANMTALGLKEPAVVDKVVASGGIPDYDARMFPSPANMQQLPLVMIEATDADEEAVSITMQLVTAQAEETLRNLQQQAQVPDAQMVRPFMVSPPSTPAAGMPARTARQSRFSSRGSASRSSSLCFSMWWPAGSVDGARHLMGPNRSGRITRPIPRRQTDSRSEAQK